jgi:hypothetical protein
VRSPGRQQDCFFHLLLEGAYSDRRDSQSLRITGDTARRHYDEKNQKVEPLKNNFVHFCLRLCPVNSWIIIGRKADKFRESVHQYLDVHGPRRVLFFLSQTRSMVGFWIVY